ncbi:MAG: hypothetical protein WD025_09020 [Bacteriovoracaceae bacterium]
MKNILFLALLMPSLSHALKVTITPSADCNAAGTTCTDSIEQAERDINNDLPDVNEDDYAAGFAKSTAFAYKGMGSDYSDNFTFFVFKAAGGVAIESESGFNLEESDSVKGAAPGGALTVGLNLDLLPVDKIGPVEFKKMDLFFNFMSYSMDQDLDDMAFEGDISALGVFARYRLMDPVDILPGYMLEWGGIHLHTGIQRSSMDLNFSQTFNGTADAGGTTVRYDDTKAIVDIESAVTSIPIEFSTYLRTLYVLTLYGGAGLDVNMGEAEINLDGNGTVTSDDGNTDYGTLEASGNGTGSPEATNFRAFGGVQINIPFVRVYAQVNKALGSDLIGANAGVKILW